MRGLFVFFRFAFAAQHIVDVERQSLHFVLAREDVDGSQVVDAVGNARGKMASTLPRNTAPSEAMVLAVWKIMASMSSLACASPSSICFRICSMSVVPMCAMSPA